MTTAHQFEHYVDGAAAHPTLSCICAQRGHATTWFSFPSRPARFVCYSSNGLTLFRGPQTRSDLYRIPSCQPAEPKSQSSPGLRLAACLGSHSPARALWSGGMGVACLCLPFGLISRTVPSVSFSIRYFFLCFAPPPTIDCPSVWSRTPWTIMDDPAPAACVGIATCLNINIIRPPT